MSARELEAYLHRHIPLSKAMAVTVVAADEDTVTLSAPLEPNVNHRGTVFGGSASALAMLAAWALLHTRLTAAGIRSALVVRRNTMDFRAPLTGEFTARASLVEPEAWPAFVARLERKGKAKIEARAVLEHDGVIAGELRGEFVALGHEAESASPPRARSRDEAAP